MSVLNDIILEGRARFGIRINQIEHHHVGGSELDWHENLRAVKQNEAFTLIEFALVLLIAALMFSTIRPAYTHLANEAKSKGSVNEIEDISAEIDDFYEENGDYPDSLEEVFDSVPIDPWGNPYQYLRIDGGSVSGLGQLRKDKNLVPINSDYDLYSKGPDGESVPPLTGNPSKDDIVRGRNGGFFGPATEY